MAHNQLRIHQYIPTENQRRHGPIRQLRRAIIREEGGHEPEQDQRPQAPKQVRRPRREVVLSLTREERQRDEDPERQDQGLEHDPRVVEGGYHRDGVGLERGEAAQEEQVGRVGFALPEGEEHDADGAEQRYPHQPLVALDPVLVARADEGDGAE